MSARISTLFFRAPVQHDWTQQELAEFYRVEAVLIQSGVSLETDRGLSDEGDPWFIFCRPQTGDVVVHFARYGSEYIAAGGALDGVLRGRSFREIIDTFMSRQPIVVSSGKTSETSLYLHPAALLSAFVATAFFLFTNTDADAAYVQDGKEIQTAQPSDNARVPGPFQVLIEAAGLAGNRDAWITLSMVAIAFSIGAADLQDDRQAFGSAGPDLQTPEASNADTQALQRYDQAASYNAETQAQVKWANADFDTQSDSLVNEPQIEGSDKASIITAIEAGASSSRLKEGNPSDKNGVAAIVNVGAAGIHDVAISQARTLEKSLELDSFMEPTPMEPYGHQTADTASEAYELVREGSDIARHSVPSVFLTQALINAIATSPRIEGASYDYVAAEINLNDNSINLAVFDGDKLPRNDMLPSAEVTIDPGQDPHTSAVLALEWFTQSHPDFMVVSLGRNVVVFDLSTIDKVQVSIELHTWIMHDGSTINIIGSLPDAFLAAA